MSFVILIPARMKSTRLPNKPMADIEGLPMIVRVAERGRAAGAGRGARKCEGTEQLRKILFFQTWIS